MPPARRPARRTVVVVAVVVATLGTAAAAAITEIGGPATVTRTADRVRVPVVTGTSLRFAGTGAGDVDRVKIPLTATTPVNAGGDLTIELWIRGTLAENPADRCGTGDAGWINGHVVVDRDVYGAGDRGDYGISLNGGRVAWGVSRGAAGATVCGATRVLDGEWHHVAVTRSAATGALAIWVDGVLDAAVASTPAVGDVSYRVGRSTAWPASDPFLVLGAEKHDAGTEYPSFAGSIDDVRVSSVVRYTAAFARPTAPHAVDAATVALYRFDEAGGTDVVDELGASPGVLRIGGPAATPTREPATPFGP